MSCDLIIYMPTYNRPHAVQKQVSAIENALLSIGTELKVRVIIQDNASPRGVSVTSKNIDVRRNGINIGGNANIALGFCIDSLLEANYLWILSDNDFLAPNFLSAISNELKSNKYDFIVFDDKISKPAYDKVSQGQHKYIWHKGLISNCLFATRNLRHLGEIPFLYHNSSFPHLAVAMSILNEREHSSYAILPLNKVFVEDYTIEEKGDYKLSEFGMPLLINLMDKKFAFIFAIKWLSFANLQKTKRNKRLHFVRAYTILILLRTLGPLYFPCRASSMIYQFLRKINRALK